MSFLDYDDLNGINLWCYCDNNPVMNFDYSGYYVISVYQIIYGFAHNLFEFYLFSRRTGKPPPKKWPILPPNLAGKNQSGIPMVIGKKEMEKDMSTMMIHMVLVLIEAKVLRKDTR